WGRRPPRRGGPGAPPQGGYGPGGYPPAGPGGPGGYGPGGYGYGGYPPPPPPPPGGGKGPKIAGTVVGAVVVLAIVGGALAWLGSGSGDNQASAGDSPAPATSPSGKDVPYVKLAAGDCFDSPGLDSKVTVITRRSCDTPHYAQVVSDEKLTGVISSQEDLETKAFAACEADLDRRMESISGGGDYYPYIFYPALVTYQMGYEDTVACSLTKSHGKDGKKLTAPLP
ncbi:hypothetical protein K7472_14865, partial [Streptomyces sp. PTM05]